MAKRALRGKTSTLIAVVIPGVRRGDPETERTEQNNTRHESCVLDHRRLQFRSVLECALQLNLTARPVVASNQIDVRRRSIASVSSAAFASVSRAWYSDN
jgi:hypothetical protein